MMGDSNNNMSMIKHCLYAHDTDFLHLGHVFFFYKAQKDTDSTSLLYVWDLAFSPIYQSLFFFNFKRGDAWHSNNTNLHYYNKTHQLIIIS